MSCTRYNSSRTGTSLYGKIIKGAWSLTANAQMAPGNLGINGDVDTGGVLGVHPQGQCRAAGVKVGWVMVLVNGVPYSRKVMGEAIKSNKQWTASFDTSCEVKYDSNEAELSFADFFNRNAHMKLAMRSVWKNRQDVKEGFVSHTKYMKKIEGYAGVRLQVDIEKQIVSKVMRAVMIPAYFFTVVKEDLDIWADVSLAEKRKQLGGNIILTGSCSYYVEDDFCIHPVLLCIRKIEESVYKGEMSFVEILGKKEHKSRGSRFVKLPIEATDFTIHWLDFRRHFIPGLAQEGKLSSTLKKDAQNALPLFQYELRNYKKYLTERDVGVGNY